MKFHKLILGPVQANCYILEKDGQALIIDPGDEAHKIVNKIDSLELKPLAVILTHGHFDHIGALDQIRDHFEIPAYIHASEEDFLQNPELNFSSFIGQSFSQKPADHLIEKEGDMTLGPFSFEVRHTPGHSPGSISLVFEEDYQVIAGDTLFKCSIGRTDFFNADSDTLLTSIQTKLLILDGNFTVYPGHGPATKISTEKSQNPFLNF